MQQLEQGYCSCIGFMCFNMFLYGVIFCLNFFIVFICLLIDFIRFYMFFGLLLYFFKCFCIVYICFFRFYMFLNFFYV